MSYTYNMTEVGDIMSGKMKDALSRMENAKTDSDKRFWDGVMVGLLTSVNVLQNSRIEVDENEAND